jgi:hypothetical protein
MRPELIPDGPGPGCTGVVIHLFVQGLFPSLQQPPQAGMPAQPVSLQARLASLVFWGVLVGLTALALWGMAR